MSTITRQSQRKKKESATEKSIPEKPKNNVIEVEVKKRTNKVSQETKFRGSTRTKPLKTAAVKDKQSPKKTVITAMKEPLLEQNPSLKKTDLIPRRGRPLKDSTPADGNTKDPKKKQPAMTRKIVSIINEDQQKKVNIPEKKETFLRKRSGRKLTPAADNSRLKQSEFKISEQVKIVKVVESGNTVVFPSKSNAPSQHINQQSSEKTRDDSVLSAKSKDQPDASTASDDSLFGQSPKRQQPQHHQQQVLQNNHVPSMSGETVVGPVAKSHINQYEPYWKQLKKQKLETENLKNQVNHLQKMLQEKNHRIPLMPVIGQHGDPLGFHVSPFLQFQGLRGSPIRPWTNSFTAVPHTQYYQQAFFPGINHSGWVPRAQPSEFLFNAHIPFFQEEFNHYHYQ